MQGRGREPVRVPEGQRAESVREEEEVVGGPQSRFAWSLAESFSSRRAPPRSQGTRLPPLAAQLYLVGVSVEFLQGRLQLSLTVGRGPRCGLACVPLSFGPCCAQRSFWTWWRLPWGPGARWPGQGRPGPQRSGLSRTTLLGFCGHRPPDTSSNGSVDVRAGALWPPVSPAALMMQ